LLKTARFRAKSGVMTKWLMSIRRPKGGVLLALAAAAIACVPLLCSRVPPLYDYPAHLARMWITADLLTHRHASEMYALHPAIVPNLATDLFVVPLVVAGVNVEIAGRLCLAALILGIGVGVVRLNRALMGGVSALPVLAFGLVYAEPFQFGFINYIAGVGVLLNALAFWVSARNPARLVAIGAVGCVVLFLCHLIACVAFIGAVLTLEVFDASREWWRGGQITAHARRAAALVPGILLTAMLYKLAPLADTGAHDSMLQEFWKHPPVVRDRLGMLFHAVDGYRPLLDWTSLAVLLLVLAVSWQRGRLRLHLTMVPVILGLTAVFAVFPDHWAGTSYIVDRLPFLIALLALASLDVIFVTPRGRAIFASLILAMVVMRGASAALVWRKADIAYAPMITALSALPDGTRIYTATIYHDTSKTELVQPFAHLPAVAALRHVVFDAGVFADPSQNIVVQTPAYRAVGKLMPPPFRSGSGKAPQAASAIFTPDLLAMYDDVLVVHPEQYPAPLPSSLVRIASAGYATLFRIAH
jgi:hypothetical protein